MEIKFDADKHEYTVDGKVLPSVTQILKAAGVMPDFYKALAPRYKNIGTATHLACQLDDENDLDEKSIDERVAPKLKAYREWKKEFGVITKANEMFVCHGDLGYAGTLDKLVSFTPEKEVWLIDVKGESTAKYHSIQTMAYLLALEWMERATGKTVDLRRRGALYLKKEGTYRFIQHENGTGDANDWLAAVAKVKSMTGATSNA
jgi:hypothetical protein